MTTTPRNWAAGEVVTAALLNIEIRDQLNSMFDAWTSYTPAWTAATTNPVLGNGSIVGRYMKIGRTVHMGILLTGGSTTTWGAGAYSIAAPFTSANIGVGFVGAARLAGTDTWAGICNLSASTTLINIQFPASATNTRASNMQSNSPEVHAAGTSLRLSLTYQSAT